MSKQFKRMYCTAYGGAFPILVSEHTAQGRTVYLSDSGNTYSQRQIKTWDELSLAQQQMVFDWETERQQNAIDFAIAKDQTLSSMRQQWENAINKQSKGR